MAIVSDSTKTSPCYREDGCGRKAGINKFDLNVRDLGRTRDIQKGSIHIHAFIFKMTVSGRQSVREKEAIPTNYKESTDWRRQNRDL